MNKSPTLKVISEYALLGTKLSLAFIAAIFNTILASYVYFAIDLIHSFYQKYNDDKNSDLTIDNLEKLKRSSGKLRKDFDQMATTQRKYEREREIKENSLKLLNKLIAEGLIRERDLLSLAGSSGYFQLFIYSAPLRRIAKSLGLDTPVRQYPRFLEELGFVRLGRNSTFFLINKNRLKSDRLKEIINMKKFLIYHLSKIRQKEWSDFLQIVKERNKKEYQRLNKRGYIDWGYLKYNFLLTETNMNPTNVGMVDDEYIGLAPVADNEQISGQILEKSNERHIELNRELKVKIRKIIEKLDVTILLDGVSHTDKNIIVMKQDILKKNLNLVNIIELHKINKKDLIQTLINMKIAKDHAQKIAVQLIDTTRVYQNALTELNITI